VDPRPYLVAHSRLDGQQPPRRKTTLLARHWNFARTRAPRMLGMDDAAAAAAADVCGSRFAPSCRRQSLRTATSRSHHLQEAAAADAECHSQTALRSQRHPLGMRSASRRTRASSLAAKGNRCSSMSWPDRSCGRNLAFARRLGPANVSGAAVLQDEGPYIPTGDRAGKLERNSTASRGFSVKVQRHLSFGSRPGPPMGMRQGRGSCWRL
jgi:hypothetical protein